MTNAADPNSIPCVICEYDLRGLGVDGKCPECGSDIAVSLRGDRLIDANPFWVQTLAQAAMVLVLALICVAIDEASMDVAGFPRTPRSLDMSVFNWTGTFRQFAEPLLMLGYYLLATPQRPEGSSWSPWGNRWSWSRATRCVILILVAYSILPWNVTRSPGLRSAIQIVSSLIGVFFVLCQYQLLHDLARRLGDDVLYRHLPPVMYATMALRLLGAIAPLLSRAAVGPNAMPAIILIAALQLTAELYLLVLMIRCRRLLFSAAESASARWMRHAGAS